MLLVGDMLLIVIRNIYNLHPTRLTNSGFLEKVHLWSLVSSANTETQTLFCEEK